jgi:beta-RFAP synthase
MATQPLINRVERETAGLRAARGDGLPGVAADSRVDVDTSARLHLGFLDLSGELGRRFGSLGLAVDGFPTRLQVRPAAAFSASGPAAERARASAERLCAAMGVPGAVHVEVREATPGHMGLGSGTQLCLAVGAALDRLYGLGQRTAAIAEAAGRGARSGIGVGSFDSGGFLVDGGRGTGLSAPPVIARLRFPEAWRVLLIIDRSARGLHGKPEVDAFRRLAPFPPALAAHLCRLALMRVMPALAEQDFAPFALGIAEIQRAVGDHFAPAQGGRYASPAVAEALALAEAAGFPGVGQSSWGPTGFVLVPSAADAQRLARTLAPTSRAGTTASAALELRIVSGCNRGSRITYRTGAETPRSLR